MRFSARLPLLLVSLALPVSSQGAAKELEGERAAAATVCPSPEEARAKMSVPEGYEVRCFAHEPMVQNPVAMTWDPRGRLWVVEAYEYPEGSPHPAPFGGEAKDDTYHPVPSLAGQHPRDRVIILEDTDNDGKADKRTVFVEGLNLASAILYGDNGVYVGQQPHLLHFRDDNGDDKPDAWRVVLTGFGREDTHELINSLCWGPDGWMYMTHGVFTNSKVRSPMDAADQGFKFDAGIGRARPVSGSKPGAPRWEFEVFADGTSNPWGCDYDSAGNFFVSACVIDHFFHMAPGGIYVRQGGAPENPYSYELLPSIVKHKHFRAAYAGVQIYQGGRYPEDTWGHAFIGNIHDNAIHEEIISPVGASFKCEPRRDFLRANDGWFRPVSTQTGPDGFLWVMDWCDKYPCYQNAKANPEGVDRDRGRIWRVVHTASDATASRTEKELNLQKLSAADLVKTLEHTNNWMRRMARRMLAERNTLGAAELARLNENWIQPANPATAIESFWTLSNLKRQPELVRAASSASPMIRSWFARYLYENSENAAAAELVKLASATEPAVRSAVATALRGWTAGKLTVGRGRQPLFDDTSRVLLPLIQASADSKDPFLAFQIWMVLDPLVTANPAGTVALLEECAVKSQPLSRVLVHKAMRRLCDTRKEANVELATAFCARLKDQDILLAHALDGLVKGQEGGPLKPAADVSQHLAAWRAHTNADVRKHAQTLAVLWGDDAAVKEMIAVLQDGKKSVKDRVAVLQSLRKVRTETVKAGIKPLLAPETTTVLAVAAIRAAADLGGDDFIPALVGQAAAKDFNVRNAAIEALAGREAWTQALLNAIAEGKVPSAGFPAPVRRQLATSQVKAVRDHAFRVLGAWQDSSEDIKALIAQKKQASLTGEPDLANGKLMFQATCMVCHEFHGGGQKVGPDLIGSGRSNLDALLANVIDPNQIIGNGYENFTVSTKDGRTLAGRVVEDTPGHVKLLGAGGATQVVPRDQVVSLTNTKQSLMPMGFGNLPDTAFRDLIWYILAPPEEGPLTKAKKDLLIKGVEGAEPPKPRGTNWRAIDWESISLWNPAWKVAAPDFERTPVKLADYYGKPNVLLMHPFPDKKTPASLENKFQPAPGKNKLFFRAAADDRGDWELRVVVNGKLVKSLVVDHEKPRWKEVEVDLAPWNGLDTTVRLEAHANGWSMEFAYLHGIELK